MKIFSKLQHLFFVPTTKKSYANLWLAVAGKTIPFGDPADFRHPTVVIDGIELDKKISGLILELWCMGIETSGSCQGDAKLDEKAFNSAANYYGGCYSTFIALPKLDDARIVAKALENACDSYGLQSEKRRIRLATDADVSFVHLNFPAKFLTLGSFWDFFVESLEELKST